MELGWGAQEEAPASGSMEAAMMESTMYLAVGSQGWLVLIPAWGGRGRLLYERGIFSSWSGDGGHPPSGNSGSSLGLLGRWEAESLLFGDLELEFRFSLHALSSLDHILRLEKKKISGLVGPSGSHLRHPLPSDRAVFHPVHTDGGSTACSQRLLRRKTLYTFSFWVI